MPSYTAHRLEHASPEHLDITTRRTFLGPVPAGWLRSNRKQWYKEFLSTKHDEAQAPGSGFDGTAESQHERLQQPTDQASVSPQLIEPRVDEPSRQATLTSTTSSTSLLHSQHADSSSTSQDVATPNDAPTSTQPARSQTISQTLSKVSQAPRVRFTEASKLQLRARAKRLASKTGSRSSTIKEGALLKAEKMLVRIDVTKQHLQDYDERISQGVETRTLDKWREYMVVCRKHVEGDAEAVLQLHQTRVIAPTEDQKVKTRAKDQIPLSQTRAKVNLFSSLDKTLCLWTTKHGRTTIYYLKPEYSAAAVEWFSFLRSMMGLGRPRTLNINVPDLRISLRLTDPFRADDYTKEMQEAAEGNDQALVAALSHEAGAARAIIDRCTAMLEGSAQWRDVLKLWSDHGHGHIGLAWKRYDSIEWIHGSAERGMYGSLAMSQTHDLELRSMDHYPTVTADKTEPRAAEGFLMRLSQNGISRRLGKLLFKRLYFTTQDHYLVFLRPARASLPPPPISSTPDGTAPSSKQLADEVPTVFNVDPYSADRLKPEWLESAQRQSIASCDTYAEADAQRQVSMLLQSDGFIDLCDVKQVRKKRPEDSAQDTGEAAEGDEVDFDIQVPDHAGPDGLADEVDEDRIFELVMRNGLTIHLQAASKAMRAQWIKRLSDLVEYWTARIREDMQLYQSVRQQNLKALRIDERAEAVVGQFAYKWEVSQSYASPQLYNVCGLSSCRAVHHSGVLFRKPRRHATFGRCHVILSHGHMLIYQDTVRKQSGKSVSSSQHIRTASIDLQGCYLYSGLLTENDLLYQNQTFDSNAPGHHTLPRIYLNDGWTSSDEDAMTTFVIWHGTSKSWFKSSKTVDDAKDTQHTSTKLKRVSKLGTTGRSVVFKARSRAERDHWVLAIQNEIERLASSATEDVRLAK